MTLDERDALMLSYLEGVKPLLRRYAATTALDYDDLHQEAAVTIMHILETQPEMRQHSGYILTSVRNRTLDLIRAATYRQTTSLDKVITDEKGHPITLADLIPSPYRVDPLLIVIALERLQELRPRLLQPGPGNPVQTMYDLYSSAIASIEMRDGGCAWCNKEQGRHQGSGSHGICQKHFYQVLQAHRRQRRKRHQEVLI